MTEIYRLHVEKTGKIQCPNCLREQTANVVVWDESRTAVIVCCLDRGKSFRAEDVAWRSE